MHHTFANYIDNFIFFLLDYRTRVLRSDTTGQLGFLIISEREREIYLGPRSVTADLVKFQFYRVLGCIDIICNLILLFHFSIIDIRKIN